MTASAQYFQIIQTVQLFYKGIAFCHGLYLPGDVYLPPGDHEMNWDLNDFNISPENFYDVWQIVFMILGFIGSVAS